MEEKKSVLQMDLNLIFVYATIFLFGLITIVFMTTILDNKVNEINAETYSLMEQRN